MTHPGLFLSAIFALWVFGYFVRQRRKKQLVSKERTKKRHFDYMKSTLKNSSKNT